MPSGMLELPQTLLRTSVLRIAGQRILRGLGEEEEGHHAEKAESSLAQA